MPNLDTTTATDFVGPGTASATSATQFNAPGTASATSATQFNAPGTASATSETYFVRAIDAPTETEFVAPKNEAASSETAFVGAKGLSTTSSTQFIYATETVLEAMPFPVPGSHPVFRVTVTAGAGHPVPTGQVHFTQAAVGGGVVLDLSGTLDGAGQVEFSATKLENGGRHFQADYLGDTDFNPSSANLFSPCKIKCQITVV
jgi:hypothetical protein